MTAALAQLVDVVTSAVLTVAVHAQDPVPADDEVKPGWIALGLTVLMVVATFLLWMNMRKQLGKIDFEEEPDEPAEADRGDGGEEGNGAGDDPEGDGADHPTPSGGASP
jgi:hypothetical protein